MNIADCGCPTDGEFIYHMKKCAKRDEKKPISLKELAKRMGIDLSRVTGEDIDVITGKRMNNE